MRGLNYNFIDGEIFKLLVEEFKKVTTKEYIPQSLIESFDVITDFFIHNPSLAGRDLIYMSINKFTQSMAALDTVKQSNFIAIVSILRGKNMLSEDIYRKM